MTARARLLVFAGGCLGTLLRFVAGSPPPVVFPWPTLLVNLAGTGVLGYLVGRRDRGELASDIMPFLGVGAMGSLTTFGTMAVQIIDLAAGGRVPTACLYAAAGVVLGSGIGIVSVRLGQVMR